MGSSFVYGPPKDAEVRAILVSAGRRFCPDQIIESEIIGFDRPQSGFHSIPPGRPEVSKTAAS